MADGSLLKIIRNSDTDGSILTVTPTTTGTTWTDALTLPVTTLNIPGTVTTSFSGSTIEFAAAGTYDLRPGAHLGTITLKNTSGGAVTVKIGPTVTIVNSGPSITVNTALDRTIDVSNLIAGSWLWVYDTTNAVTLYNAMVAGTSYSVPVTYLANRSITVRVVKPGYTDFQTFGTFTSSGLSVAAIQPVNAVYATYGKDGSIINKFAADYVHGQVDVVAATNFDGSEFYAWWCYNLWSANGIANFFGGITAIDAGNLRNNTSIVSIMFDNLSSANLRQTDSIRIFRDDGLYPVYDPTTGGGGINVNWQAQVYVAGLTSVATDVTAIVAKLPTAGAKIAGEGTIAKNLDQVAVDISTLATHTDVNNAVTSIKGASNKDLTQVFNNTPSIDPATVWAYSTRTLTAPSGLTPAQEIKIDGIKTKTDNLPTAPAAVSDVPSAATNAAAVRTNLATELAQLATAPDNASIATIVTKLPSASAKIAGEGTIAKNLDQVAVDISTLATHTDVDNAVTSIKGASSKDLTQVFNNTPSIDPATVWAYSTRTLTVASGLTPAQELKIDGIKTKTDNLPVAPAAVSDIPTAVTNATAVRTNLTTELARIDVPISTRLATPPTVPPILGVIGDSVLITDDNSGIMTAEDNSATLVLDSLST
jgi:hypothetical protein